jgi:CDP-diacylglycerol--glycerol-3-phosphate 3-phosphatidyltransferase
MIMIIIMLLNNYPFALIGLPMDQIFIWIATALTIISGADYIIKNKQVLK